MFSARSLPISMSRILWLRFASDECRPGTSEHVRDDIAGPAAVEQWALDKLEPLVPAKRRLRVMSAQNGKVPCDRILMPSCSTAFPSRHSCPCASPVSTVSWQPEKSSSSPPRRARLVWPVPFSQAAFWRLCVRLENSPHLLPVPQTSSRSRATLANHAYSPDIDRLRWTATPRLYSTS
jgi:hypothetical protein